MAQSSRRDELVDTALRLFYTRGFHATGIDTILAEAGVAKMTLYKHFKSKDDLVMAALQLRDERFRSWLTTVMDGASDDPREQLLALFDALDDWFGERAMNQLGFHGCAFIKAASEYGAQDNPIHRASALHKQMIVDHLRQLAAASGAADPEKLAEELALLKEGAIVTAQVRNMPGAAQRAKAVARIIIDDACGSSATHS